MVGGLNYNERNVLIFTPEYIEEEQPFSIIKITTNKFQKQLTHREVLGSVLGTGIAKEKIGDILFNDDECYIIILKEIEKYLLDNLEYIGNRKITPKKVKTVGYNFYDKKEDISTTVASNRIDVIVASMTNLSRTKVKELIESEKVFLNFVGCTNFSKELEKGDILSIRGHGRFQIIDFTGFSKKGKLILKYNKS